MNVTAPIIRDPVSVAIAKNVITVVLALAIIYINGILVHIFRKHQVFYMNTCYILYSHLVLNDIITLTMTVLLQVLSYISFTLNVSFCIIVNMTGVSSSLNNPLTLAAMALECYLAICFPLRHPQICTVKKTYVVIAVIWFLSSLAVIPDVFVLLAKTAAEYFSSNVFCLWSNIFTNLHLKTKRDTVNILYLVSVWLILFYCYFRIFFTAQAASANAKKARNTVLLHSFQLLLCMLTYVHNITIQGLTNLFPKDVLTIRYLITLLITVMPRLISPMVYGVRDSIFREYLKRYLLFTNTQPKKVEKRPL